jgi:GNAT superfamily N-acetyltransferase
VTQAAHLRTATPRDAAVLTDLALRSKRFWGYDDDFMQAIAPDMVVLPEYLEYEHGIVAEYGEVIAGYAILRVEGALAHLRDLFIEPAFMNRGLGTVLLGEAVRIARSAGAKRLRLVSDPNAVPFYVRRGFSVEGYESSSYLPGRSLPVMSRTL